MIKRFFSAILILAIMPSFASCGEKKALYTYTSFDYFDTVTLIYGYAESREEFDGVCGELEKIMQKHNMLCDAFNNYETPNIKTINDNAGASAVTVDAELIELLEFSLDICQNTNGLVNIAIGSVSSLWKDFISEKTQIPPSENELSKYKSHISLDSIVIDKEQSTVFISDSLTEIDLGAVAKGYVAQIMAEYLKENGINSYAINIGGNIVTVGKRTDGTDWQGSIENPEGSGNYLEKSFSLTDMALVTSGSYNRYRDYDGKRYHHIIDTETLFPENRYLSVSIYSTSSALADALSTALFNTDVENGKAILKAYPDTEALWIMADGSYICTENFPAF